MYPHIWYEPAFSLETDMNVLCDRFKINKIAYILGDLCPHCHISPQAQVFTIMILLSFMLHGKIGHRT